MSGRAGFTFIELLVAITIVAVVMVLGSAVYQRAIQQGRQAASIGNIRQLALAGILYANEHGGALFPYRAREPGGTVWWFGYESAGSAGRAEGSRELEKERSPLYPYLQSVGGVEICPGFMYDRTIWKPKFNGASYGYGYNVLLGGGWQGTAPTGRLTLMERPSEVAMFATCAQVNTFQAPASASNPLVEEFYGFDQRERTIHFRFGDHALVAFCDGHVRRLPMEPGTLDGRKPEARVGRWSPVGSFQYLR